MSSEPLSTIPNSRKSVLLLCQSNDHTALINEVLRPLSAELIEGVDDLSVAEQVRRHKPNLLLLTADFLPDVVDIMMPPMVVISDTHDGDTLAKYVSLGASDFVFLPLQSTLLRQRFEQQLMLADAHHIRREWQLNSLKLKDLGELIGLISHEIASPLGNINTAVSFLLESSGVIRGSYETKELAAADLERFLVRLNRALTMSVKNGNNASGIISSFRNVATNQCLEKLNHFYLHRYIDDVILTLKSKLKKLPHEIHVVIGESVEMVSYSGVIAQVITALINKSISYGFDDKIEGKIIISALVKTDDSGVERVLLNYMDDGCGMPESAYANLFKATNQDESFEDSNGLSMTMLKYLVEDKLQGTLTVTSVVDEGISCTLDLPHKLVV
jgi:signal transduction histidine kinase